MIVTIAADRVSSHMVTLLMDDDAVSMLLRQRWIPTDARPRFLAVRPALASTSEVAACKRLSDHTRACWPSYKSDATNVLPA